MKRTVVHAALLSALCLWAKEPIKFDREIRSIEHDGYTFRSEYLRPNQEWTVEVSKGPRAIRKIVLGWSLYDDEITPSAVAFSRQRIVNSEREQLFIRLFSSGKNCCHDYWLIGEDGGARPLLDTSRYYFDELTTVEDLDGDGTVELGFATTAFNSFWSDYASSPSLTAWFRYNQSTRRFEPANHRLPARILHASSTQDDFRGLLNVVLPLLYARRDAEAGALVDEKYNGLRKEELWPAIQQRLAKDAFYQDLLKISAPVRSPSSLTTPLSPPPGLSTPKPK